ncbi:MAG: hypothetical protein HOP12_15000 [Candidatus Eisenbacteria bacterium]|uniref:Glycosyltransferase RgtA/B/C/D-like domain-containing protein n=1 Tax=Eiseniibacteriota bacterium TaxID=2212470 RepID=A0A849SLY9_UNCEI|nr:hypothetical protein [Candidatus Eisenbacteria bacterium]
MNETHGGGPFREVGSRAHGTTWLLPTIALAWIACAGLGGLLEPTETRYAEIAREMNVTHDWLLPRLNGVLHLHKPPLAYWATALGMNLFGPEAFGARLFAVLASLLMVTGLVAAAQRGLAHFAPNATGAAAILATTALVAGFGRSLASDPFLAGAVAWYWALAPSPLAIAAIGVGFLAKGPVVLVHTLLPVLVVAGLSRDRSAMRWLGPGSGWLLAGAIALPWYLLAMTRVKGLLGYWLTDHLWGRYAATIHERGGPPWYFLGVLAVGVLPWLALLIAGIARAWRERDHVAPRLVLAWLFVPLAFFSFSGSKLPAYLLPAFPAAALLAAFGAQSRVARIATALTCAGLGVAGAWLGPRALGHIQQLPSHVPVGGPPLAYVACALLVIAALPVWRGRLALGGACVLAAWTALIAALAPFEAPLGSPRPIARLLAEQRVPGERVVLVNQFNAGLPFYLRETLPMVDVPRETRFDSEALKHSLEVPGDSVAAWAARSRRVWLFGPERGCEELAERHALTFTPLARWRRSVLGFAAR